MIIKINKKLVGGRIKSFLQYHFQTIENAAKHFNTTSNTISSGYINGKSLPGVEFLNKLLSLECDLNWLFTGVYSDSLKSLMNNIDNFRNEMEYDKKKLAKTLKVNVNEVDFNGINYFTKNDLLLVIDMIKKKFKIVEKAKRMDTLETPLPGNDSNQMKKAMAVAVDVLTDTKTVQAFKNNFINESIKNKVTPSISENKVDRDFNDKIQAARAMENTIGYLAKDGIIKLSEKDKAKYKKQILEALLNDKEKDLLFQNDK